MAGHGEATLFRQLPHRPRHAFVRDLHKARSDFLNAVRPSVRKRGVDLLRAKSKFEPRGVYIKCLVCVWTEN